MGWSGILNKYLSNSDFNDSRGFLTSNICFRGAGNLLYKVRALNKKRMVLQILYNSFIIGIFYGYVA